MAAEQTVEVDFIETGSGPLVVLVHSSMSGARQWSGLMDDLGSRFRVRAINLFGYGRTPSWPGRRAPCLGDYADLVIAAIPTDAQNVSLVGHSFGGAVVMQAARQTPKSIQKLALIEPSLFYLLRLAGRNEAFAEIAALSDSMKQHVAAGAPEKAAERFITYWAGPGGWTGSSPNRKAVFIQSVRLVLDEFDAVLVGKTAPETWAAILPKNTLVVSSAQPERPSQEVMEVLSPTCAHWQFKRTTRGGHMVPLTHPGLVNPILGSFLEGDSACNKTSPAGGNRRSLRAANRLRAP